MVDVEVALAAACVDEGLIPPQAGEAILPRRSRSRST